MSKVLPPHANVLHLKKQAKDLLRAVLLGQTDALDRIARKHPRGSELLAEQATSRVVFLHDAQLVLAREYGFDSWPKLHAALEEGSAEEPVSEALEAALRTLKRGGMVILFDDEGRENEGDIVLAAEKVTPEAINFITRHARGTLCLAMAPDLIDQLDLPLMAPQRTSIHEPAFTVSIDAAEGVTTGVSAADRARTIAAASGAGASRASVRTPGHVFPLRAEEGGVLARVGHTEGSVDLMRLCGLRQAAVICEILNDDGSMARMIDLKSLASAWNLPLVTISDVLRARQ